MSWLWFRIKMVSANMETWWQEVVEFDVCVALARFAENNPTSRFALDHASKNSKDLVFEDVSHPCLSPLTAVPNSLLMKRDSPLVLLTGSNMAGKEHFLRTLGLNVVLSHMGGPIF